MKRKITDWRRARHLTGKAEIISWIKNYYCGGRHRLCSEQLHHRKQQGSKRLHGKYNHDRRPCHRFQAVLQIRRSKRGDIVIFHFPDDPTDTIYYVKRIIGLPGDTVDIIDGKVYLNGSGTPLDEPYIREPMDPEPPACFEVPEDSYFMMGDNRNFSADARRWENKYVKAIKSLRKVLFRYYPGIGKSNKQERSCGSPTEELFPADLHFRISHFDFPRVYHW